MQDLAFEFNLFYLFRVVLTVCGAQLAMNVYLELRQPVTQESTATEETRHVKHVQWDICVRYLAFHQLSKT